MNTLGALSLKPHSAPLFLQSFYNLAPARVHAASTFSHLDFLYPGIQLYVKQPAGMVKLSPPARGPQMLICFSPGNAFHQPWIEPISGSARRILNRLNALGLAAHGNADRCISCGVCLFPALVPADFPVDFSPAQSRFLTAHGIILPGDVLQLQVSVLAYPRILVSLDSLLGRTYRLPFCVIGCAILLSRA